MRLIRNIVVTSACAGLLMSQAATAATRSAGSLPTAGVKLSHSDRVGSLKGPSEDIVGVPTLALVLFIATLGALTILIANGTDEAQSPG